MVANATEPTDAIVLDGLSRNYGEREALWQITAAVPTGARVAVLGANGAGKTTLLRVLCGLLRPTSGTARVLGSDLPREAWAIRGKVGLLAHDPMLYRSLSVRENLAHQSRLLGVDRARSEELIEAVGLAERADEPLRGLSRGMVQRASAARSLLADPPLMLLDEPYANLDPGGREQLEPLLESNRTVVITGHDPLDLLARSDLALGLRAGRQDFLLSADEVDDQRLAALYGASPPARPKVVPT